MTQLDHLVIAARTLEEGHAYILKNLGFETQPGGRHERLGTHNRLLSLGPDAYLEVIAVDPNGNIPFQPRWFGLDDEAVRASLENGPRLLHWVARTDDLKRDADPDIFGAIHQMERGAYRWRITIPADGHLPFEACVPTLIQWDSNPPARALSDVGARLEALTIHHPEPNRVQAVLDRLGLGFRVEPGEAKLEAMINTPFGTRILK